jgi:hypothetical protein
MEILRKCIVMPNLAQLDTMAEYFWMKENILALKNMLIQIEAN